MDATRTRQRITAWARAAWSRLVAETRKVLTVDPEQARASGRDEAEIAAARTLARSAGALKGGMAKVAQLMGYFEGPGAAADAEAREALGALWDQVPGVDTADIRRVVEEDLGGPPEARFASWDDQPLAAASLGQVHAATLADGTKLAVKVQYPGVAEALRADLESRTLLRQLAGADVGTALSRESVEALRQGVLGELDYRAEAARMREFRRLLGRDRGIVVPRVLPELSSARVLTMERLEGRTLVEVAAGDEAVRARVALAIFRFAWGAPLRHRVVNADPNPGNYLVLDDTGARVGFLDYGCCIDLDESLVEIERRLWRAVLKDDGETMRWCVSEEGLLARAVTLDSDHFRRWERLLAAPFTAEGEHRLTQAATRDLVRLTSEMVRGGGLALPPKALLLWRQRLGVLSVMASLEPRADFRAALRQVLAEIE